uniref:PAP-associated domain-containing protein n=1 Tax=Acrobeloides nanus TaxID=290746 RepID=A0A914EHK5_9BILA
IYAESSLIAVGSTVNGCGSYNSDMDLCLCIPDSNSGYHTDRQYATKILSNLARRMRKWNSNLIKTVQFIRAKVPILKLTFHPPYDELEVDLNCNNVAGIYNSHLLHYYARIDDRFPALCLLVKHWAIKHEINDAQMGTFNSYSLILMVLHFLQSVASPPVLPNLQKLYPETFSGVSDIDRLGLFMDLSSPLPEHPPNERTIGELLIAFIDYYARFDFENLAISVSRACTFSRWMLPENTQRFKIYIEEPFDGLNTARCVTSVEMFNRIKLAFKTSRSQFLGSQAGPPNLKRIKVDV